MCSLLGAAEGERSKSTTTNGLLPLQLPSTTHYDHPTTNSNSCDSNTDGNNDEYFHHQHQSAGESSGDTLPTRNTTSNTNTMGEDTAKHHQPSFLSNFTLFLQAHLPSSSITTTILPSLIMKRILRTLLLSSSAIMLLIVFPLLFRYAISDAKHGSISSAAFYSAASYVVLSLVLSVREILSHLYNWYAPDVQKFVVRILFMVPLYSVQSWLGLRFHGQARIYIILLRDLYEAYVIQSFVYYLIELLGGEDRMAQLLSQKDASLGGHGQLLSHVLPRWEMGMEFLLKIKYGVLQYVVVKTFMTLITTFVLLPSGMYGEGSFGLDSAYIYTTIVLNISVMHALYCLVKLFHAIKSDLRHPVNWHPVGKFVCIKVRTWKLLQCESQYHDYCGKIFVGIFVLGNCIFHLVAIRGHLLFAELWCHWRCGELEW